MKNLITISTIAVGKFQVMKVNSNPKRLESKIVLNRDDISQKLLFTLMDITHAYGLSISPPTYNNDASIPEMIFLIGTEITGRFFGLRRLKQRMHDCLVEVSEFLDSFNKQLDFSCIDVSMFGEINIEDFSPTEIAAIRDQYFNGSWTLFKKSLIDEDRQNEVIIIDKCMEFEKENGKDLGFVGHKLDQTLMFLEESYELHPDSN